MTPEELKGKRIIFLPANRKKGDLIWIKLQAIFGDEWLYPQEMWERLGKTPNKRSEFTCAQVLEKRGRLEAALIDGKIAYRIKKEAEKK